MNLSTLFTFSPEVSLSLDDEIRAIQEAQAGDESAAETLLLAYGPAIRNAVSRFSDAMDADDLEASALLAFTETLASHDPERGERLAGRLVQILRDTIMKEATSGEAFSVPKRTLTRFYGILRAAEGDTSAARELAPSMGMSEANFDEVLTSVRSVDSLQARLFGGDEDDTAEDLLARPIESRVESSFSDVEDRLLVEVAFQAVDDEEARICELFYGFTEYDPVPDGEIGHRLGLTRPTVQRRRSSALDKMRKATGVL